jgi:tetratricopeptide (TPR) repeat protein
MAGRFEDARGWVEEGRALTRDLGLRWYEGIQDLLSAHVELLAGDPAAATRDLRAAGEIFSEIGDRWYLAYAAVALPAAVYAEGRYDDAAALAEAIEDAPAPNDLEWQIRRRAIGAKLLARKGDLDRAESLGREAVALVSASDFLGFHGDVLLDLAEVLELADRSAEAATAAEEAVRLHERKGNVVSAGRARTRAAELRGAGR